MRTTQTINWKPFSTKHKQYIRDAIQSRMSVAEGAIRSGKTIDHCIIAACYLEQCPDAFHLASGSSASNAKLNIGTCNGYGLEYLFRGRCRWGKFRDNDCLFINTQTGQKVLIFVGGGLASSYKKILGSSFGLWIATEINTHYDSEESETSFIKVAMGRQIAAQRPMTLWDLNPSAPNHPIYSQYIDRYRQTGLPGGYNYAHFTIEDNATLTRAQKDALIYQYDKNSIWYQRDILGKRVVAEGLIYRAFADCPDKYSLDAPLNYVTYTCGVDFGGNGSATTFVLVGFSMGLRDVVALESERHTEELDPVALNAKFLLFIDKCYSKYHRPFTVYADSAEQVLIRGLRRTVEQNRLPVDVKNAKKGPILNRIRLVSKLIAQNRFKWADGALTVKDALCGALWDKKKADTRLDDGTCDVDTQDALEYALEPYSFELSRHS